MRLAILAMVAVLAAAGSARAEVSIFDLFQQVCIQHPHDPAAAEAAARALGFNDSGRPTKNDPAAGIRSVDLLMRTDTDAIILGIDDDPDPVSGVRLYKCGINMTGSRPELGVALRGWAGFEPLKTSEGLQFYAYEGDVDWTRPKGADGVPDFGAPVSAGPQTTLIFSNKDDGTILLLVDRHNAKP